MTEQEWLKCGDVHKMLEFQNGQVSERKLVLFSTACCRRIWRFLPDELCRTAVEVAERYADGQAPVGECAAASIRAGSSCEELDQDMSSGNEPDYPRLVSCFAAHAACHASAVYHDPIIRSVIAVADKVASAVGTRAVFDSVTPDGPLPSFNEPCPIFSYAWQEEYFLECRLLRDIFGNPFRPVTADSAWLSPTVTSIAQAIYDERAFDRLPILTDALEDAGCTHADILNHCRQPGEHVRGCWPVDLLLGKP